MNEALDEREQRLRRENQRHGENRRDQRRDADGEAERHDDEADERYDQWIREKSRPGEVAEVMRDHGPGADRRQDRHRQREAKTPKPLAPGVLLLRELIAGADGRPPSLDLDRSPDDEKHGQKRELKRDVHDDARPDEAW